MTRHLNIYLLLATAFLLLTWLFVGFFRDDEFNEPHLFIKHRPTFKVNFYSPVGMQDFELNELSAERKAEEIAFREFVLKQDIQNNSDARLWYLPFILIQLTLTFLLFGYFKIRRKIIYKPWQLPAHFAICLVFTFLALAFILAFDKLLLTIILLILLLLINYFTLFLFARKNQIQPAASAIKM